MRRLSRREGWKETNGFEQVSSVSTQAGSPPDESHTLRRGALRAPDIFFFVVAAAAPLAAIVGNGALGILLGNGAGMPSSYLVAGIVLALFAIGFARLSPHVKGAGAFYVYVRRGLGQMAGAAAAFVAVVVYAVMVVGSAAGFGFFANLAFESQLGVPIPWEGWSAIVLAIVAIVGFREVVLGARLLAVALVLEMAILTVLIVAVLLGGGDSGISAASFKPSTVVNGSPGIGLMFAFASFLGFESAAIYSEEAREGHRTVRRALVAAVVFIAVFYALTTWSVVNAFGAGNVHAAAADGPGTLVFRAFAAFTTPAITTTVEFLMVTSALASTIALHNACARYLFALGREGMLPRMFGRSHPRLDSPHVASLVVTVVTAVLLGLFMLGNADPLVTVLSSTFGLATLGIILLQGATSVSVVAFFGRQGVTDRGTVWTLVVSAVAAACLLAAAVLVVTNYSTLAGNLGVLDYAPWLLVVAAVVGVCVALRQGSSDDATGLDAA